MGDDLTDGKRGSLLRKRSDAADDSLLHSFEEKQMMTVVICAFMDSAKRAIAYKKFTNIEEAVSFYHGLLEKAQFESQDRKPRVISTRIIVDA